MPKLCAVFWLNEEKTTLKSSSEQSHLLSSYKDYKTTIRARNKIDEMQSAENQSVTINRV